MYGAPYQQPQQPQQPYYGPPPQQVNVNQKKRSSIALPLILGALALLLIGGGVGTWFFLNQAGILGQNSAAIERALPANTLAYFQIDPNPSESQKRAFDNMRAAFESQPGFKEAIERMTGGTNELITESECFPATEGEGLDALNDYLGDSIAIAVLPPSTDDLNMIKAATESGEPGEIMTVVGRNMVGLLDLDFNPLNKRGPLAEIKKIVDSKSELVETYQGTDIRKYTCLDTTLYFGMLDGTSTAVAGVDLAPVKRIIDEYKANKGLKDSSTYKALSGKVPADRVATFYMNMTEMMRYAETIAPVEVFGSGQMPKVEGGVMLTLAGQDDGLQFDVASEIKYEDLSADLAAGSNKKPEASTITDIPIDSLGFMLGTDLKTGVTSILDALEKQNPEMMDEINTQVQQATGLDLRNDILSWMSGDWALSVSKGEAGEFGPNVPVVFQLKLSGDDRAKAADTLSKLVESAENQGGMQAESFQAAGGTFYDIGGMAVIGVGSDRLWVIALPGGQGDVRALLDTYSNNLGKGLGTTDKWKDASRHLPADSNFIFYMDVTGIREMAEEMMDESAKQDYEENVAPFIRPFKYLLTGSASDAVRENEPVRGLVRLFIGIGK
jgi:hypothetical protein